MEAAQELAPETFCLSWEEELSRTSVEKLSFFSEKLWEQSGLNAFIEEVIGKTFMLDEKQACLRIALETSKRCLIQFNEDLQSRRKGAVSQNVSPSVANFGFAYRLDGSVI